MTRKNSDYKNFFDQSDQEEKKVKRSKRVSKNKPQIEKEPRKKMSFKFKLTKKNFLLILIPVLFIILFFIVGAVAKTGIYNIPVFTQIFYRVPKPSRTISKLDALQYANVQPKYDFNQETGIFHLELTEEQATFLLRYSLGKKSQAKFADTAQVIFEDGQVEFFGLMLDPVKTNLTVSVKLDHKSSEKKLDYKISKFRIGSLNLPASLVDGIYKYYSKRKSRKFFDDIGIDISKIDFNNSAINLSGLNVDNGVFAVDIFIDVEKMRSVLEQFNLIKPEVSDSSQENLVPLKNNE